MFNKILLCTDLLPASESLVECVGQLKKLGVEEIVLTHVVYVANTPGLEVILEEDSRPVLDRQKDLLEANGFRVTTEMPFGLPAETLVETAEKYNVSLVVMGHHGHGNLTDILLGSVSSKLIHLAHLPVLLIRISVQEGENCASICGNIFSNILFPTDFSETAERAMEYLAQIAVETRSPVTLLHVCDERRLDEGSRQRLEDDSQFVAEAKRERLISLGVSNAHVEIAFGDAAKEIIVRSNQQEFSLIIMGSQGKGALQAVLHGSVSRQVVTHAGVPVLLIPPNH